MKAVGLRDHVPASAVGGRQLRKRKPARRQLHLVGFQNHLKWGEPGRVLCLHPGLENARFLRYGQIHRNTYICAPRCSMKTPPEVQGPPGVESSTTPAARRGW